MTRLARSTLLLAIALAPAGCVGGLLPASNPCDPLADDSLRRTAAITGVVSDQRGDPAAGVTVVLEETSETRTTDANGGFRFEELIPQAYTVSALPPSPGQGGRMLVPDLGCSEERGDVEVQVVIPPASPEVEITKATSSGRLLVAFSSAALEPEVGPLDEGVLGACASEVKPDPARAGDLRYWVEVREPFGSWEPAVLNPRPYSTAIWEDVDVTEDKDDDGSPDWLEPLPLHLGERCLRATCGYYTYAYSDLETYPSARCAEVVGAVGPDGTRRSLAAHGDLQVRIRTDVLATSGETAEQSIPPFVSSAPGTASAMQALVPTSSVPIPMGATEEEHQAGRAELDVRAISPVADGRFAMIHASTVLVVGAGSKDAQVEAGVWGQEMSNIDADTDDGMFFDDVTSEATDEEISDAGAQAVDMLPAGKWVRVLKQLPGGESMIDKLWVGSAWATEPAESDPPQPVFSMSPGESFRGLQWLTAPEGDPTDPDAPYNPPDAYLLLFEEGVAMLEAGGDLMADATADAPTGENASFYDVGGDLLPEGDEPLCDRMREALGVDDMSDEETKRGACLDLNAAFGGVKLSAARVLPTGPGLVAPEETVQVLSDEENDRVLVVGTDHLLRKNIPPSASDATSLVREVSVGASPTALLPSVMLAGCGGPAEERQEVPVMLVANQGSEDLSVLGTEDGPEGAVDVVERQVIPLPAAPASFFTDHGRPTCEAPFAWVVGDGGQIFPIDMRFESLGLPFCGEEPCAVEVGSRARVGAVSRDLDGKARVLLGGEGLLDEVGYLRPAVKNAFWDGG